MKLSFEGMMVSYGFVVHPVLSLHLEKVHTLSSICGLAQILCHEERSLSTKMLEDLASSL